jgi:hypothetical protein
MLHSLLKGYLTNGLLKSLLSPNGDLVTLFSWNSTVNRFDSTLYTFDKVTD